MAPSGGRRRSAPVEIYSPLRWPARRRGSPGGYGRRLGVLLRLARKMSKPQLSQADLAAMLESYRPTNANETTLAITQKWVSRCENGEQAPPNPRIDAWFYDALRAPLGVYGIPAPVLAAALRYLADMENVIYALDPIIDLRRPSSTLVTELCNAAIEARVGRPRRPIDNFRAEDSAHLPFPSLYTIMRESWTRIEMIQLAASAEDVGLDIGPQWRRRQLKGPSGRKGRNPIAPYDDWVDTLSWEQVEHWMEYAPTPDLADLWIHLGAHFNMPNGLPGISVQIGLPREAQRILN